MFHLPVLALALALLVLTTRLDMLTISTTFSRVSKLTSATARRHCVCHVICRPEVNLSTGACDAPIDTMPHVFVRRTWKRYGSILWSVEWEPWDLTCAKLQASSCIRNKWIINFSCMWCVGLRAAVLWSIEKKRRVLRNTKFYWHNEWQNGGTDWASDLRPTGRGGGGLTPGGGEAAM